MFDKYLPCLEFGGVLTCGLCPSTWLPIPADPHADYLPPVSVSTHSSFCVCICVRESVFHLRRLRLFICFSACLCMHRHVFGSARVCVWWRHVLATRYALAQKVLPDHASATARGLCAARGDEWEGMECVCTLCIWATSPLSTRQKLKLGRCGRCLHEQVNLCHVCHRKIKALVYSGALLPLLISISKQRRWHGRELSHPSRLDRTGPGV